MSTASFQIEIASSFPAEKVFKIYGDFHIITPKVNPQVFKSIEIIEGDGGVGTIRLLTFGDGLPFTNTKYRQDGIDASNFTFDNTFFEGDNLMGIIDTINYHIKIIPNAEGGSIFTQKVVYNCKGEEKPSTETLNFIKDMYEKTYKAMEAYAAEHPETY
ncbi:putative Bet v I/Major latex protein [Helianthus anomalus]